MRVTTISLLLRAISVDTDMGRQIIPFGCASAALVQHDAHHSSNGHVYERRYTKAKIDDILPWIEISCFSVMLKLALTSKRRSKCWMVLIFCLEVDVSPQGAYFEVSREAAHNSMRKAKFRICKSQSKIQKDNEPIPTPERKTDKENGRAWVARRHTNR
jgi:hypothetical protein